MSVNTDFTYPVWMCHTKHKCAMVISKSQEYFRSYLISNHILFPITFPNCNCIVVPVHKCCGNDGKLPFFKRLAVEFIWEFRGLSWYECFVWWSGCFTRCLQSLRPAISLPLHVPSFHYFWVILDPTLHINILQYSIQQCHLLKTCHFYFINSLLASFWTSLTT